MRDSLGYSPANDICHRSGRRTSRTAFQLMNAKLRAGKSWSLSGQLETFIVLLVEPLSGVASLSVPEIVIVCEPLASFVVSNAKL